MKILHTSDWHIGRTFHGHPTVDALREVLHALVDIAVRERVDVVVVAGDVFDSAMPAAEHFTLLTEILLELRDTGCTVVVTSGNHDSAARLGFQSPFLRAAGVHVITRPEQLGEPVVVSDEHGEVAIHGIPYLEPSLFRHRHPEAQLRRHDDVLEFVLRRIGDAEASLAEASGARRRTVVVSHCFAVGVPARDADAAAAEPAEGGERDITAGGLDYVSIDRFAPFDYAALGHVHGRAALSESVRYSGAPLHFSFAEADKPRGVWIVELDADGLAGVVWADLPIPRRLVVLTGTLDELLSSPALSAHESDWVSAVFTDTLRPLDAMARLQSRFPNCAALEFRPADAVEPTIARYATRVRGKSEAQIVAEFLAHVRSGVGPSPVETQLVTEAFAELDAEAAR